MNPILTVIMPVRNSATYLEAALASLYTQTDRRFVLHVWDDGSEDDTRQILDRWINKRLPGRIVGEERIGIGPALAQLVESAPTELIARMDGDDLCDPYRLEKQLAYMKAHPEVELLGTQMIRVDAEARQTLGQTKQPCEDAELRWAMRLSNPMNHPTVMMSKSAAIDCGNYRDLRPGQDDDLWLRIAQRGRIANLPEALLTYREHDQSITAKRIKTPDLFRKRRLKCAKLVFPGIGVKNAQGLMHLLTHPDDLSVTRQDIALLETTAQIAATRSGEDADYFKHTHTYRAQLSNLRTRWLKANRVIRPAWPLLRGIARLAHAA